MCYDVSLKTKNHQLRELLPDLQSEWTDEELESLELTTGPAFPTYPVLILENNRYTLKKMQWGLIPDSFRTEAQITKFRTNMLNARSDKFRTDPKSTWHRYRHQRCLVPVSGIFESRHIHGWKHTVPYFVQQAGRDTFFLPGLYAYTKSRSTPDAPPLGTFVFLTTEANSLMAKIHNRTPNDPRMPLFLSPAAEADWLNPESPDERITEIAQTHFPPNQLESWPVYTIRRSKNFSGTRPDVLGPSAPYHWPGLPDLGNDKPVEQGSLF